MNLANGVIHFITLTQPWATLMAIGAKLVETRSWSTRFRGPIAIHAAMGYPSWCRELCYRPEYCSALERWHGDKYRGDPAELPTGVVLAITELYDSVPTLKARESLQWDELQFGDYSAGRFAFLTRGLRRLREPLPMKGSLGIRRLPQPIPLEALL